ncbi:phosphoesterase [Arthrobacter sp. MYb227]|uniref:chitobiase/beta-hexosaminidase C-terminal domain-containing protein n=1 Tax=Arthrobacter sp. MYb227 TaxID=1848601 RepID=UPI000CFC2A3B|nr:chitobiase/beta-hexosaminidase C-terminal domain-containing protein [Arthrobacter sp. MYb227]PQZ94674.1 phosphoesterase [Arthrobacter sp. MYb227]
MRTSRLSYRALAVATCSMIAAGTLAAPALASSQPPTANKVQETPAAPTFSVPGGSYDGPIRVKLRAAQGETVRYTTDGTIPSKSSKASGNSSILISADTNLTAIAFKGNQPGVPRSVGYFIDSKEQPKASFMIMSDVHIGNYDSDKLNWAGYFDTIGEVLGAPDAILSNGDMINDNWNGKGKDHQITSRIFQENMKRKGMDDTEVFLSYGNHDATLAELREGYPQGWFPDTGGGYYRAEVQGVPTITVNTENYSSAQSTWLTEQLTEIGANATYDDLPVIVQGHRPISGTVMDGQQSSNAKLGQDLAKFPRAIYFSGHSHLNLNDPRSIHQKNFTAVNEGSSSYIEIDHGYQMLDAAGELANRFETPTAQGVAVEVYEGRTVIKRVNLNADWHDIYTNGTWSANFKPPFFSSGTLAGSSWNVSTAGNDDQVREAFVHTDANRNKTAPFWEVKNPVQGVDLSDGRLGLKIAQAKDDEMVHHYRVVVAEKDTDEVVLSTKLANRFDVVPAPTSVQVPVPVPRDGKTYLVQVTAVDAQGNTSKTFATDIR